MRARRRSGSQLLSRRTSEPLRRISRASRNDRHRHVERWPCRRALRLTAARARHEPVRLVDAAGKPTNDPSDFFSGGAILPFGGHKGNGISILAQMLGRALAGMDTTGFDGPRGANGPIITAIDPACFTTKEEFASEVA